MKQHEAQQLKTQVEADKRIKVRIMGAGQGFRLRLVLYTGSSKQRILIVGNKQDVKQVTELWEGL